MNTSQCDEYYERYVDGELTHVRCTYVSGHQANHSWWTLREQDAAEAAARAQEIAQTATQTVDGDSLDIRRLLIDIRDGVYDPYIEPILTFTHDRKRVLRGQRTFSDLLGEGRSNGRR